MELDKAILLVIVISFIFGSALLVITIIAGFIMGHYLFGIVGIIISIFMNIEYEEFENTEDLLMYISSVAPPMKNFMPINSYKGFVCSFIPLSQSGGDLYLMLYAKGELETGIYEFDIKTRSITKVEAIERADKTYFIVMIPKRNTIADKAIENM